MGFIVSNSIKMHESLQRLAIVDFETTGLRAGLDRPTEVGVVIIENNRIVKQYQQLMNPGMPIPQDIVILTGITDDMVVNQPPPEEVMPVVAEMIGAVPIVCHNAPFEKKFFDAEMDNVGIAADCYFICTLALARRLIRGSDDFKLRTLTEYLKIPPVKAHRALADCLVTFELWKHLYESTRVITDGHPDLGTILKVMNTPKKKIHDSLDAVMAG
jgi:DNA polymerase-3 subunit epsilon